MSAAASAKHENFVMQYFTHSTSGGRSPTSTTGARSARKFHRGGEGDPLALCMKYS